jgi:uncharacterized protein YegP (UPF0339 family)
VLKAANHEVISQSETYASDSARDNGVARVRSNAPGADIKDEAGA